MRPLVPLLATAALTIPGGAIAAPAVAAAPTCQGQPATLVGTEGGPKVVGTAGNDVIVTEGASAVDAGPGDDLVCVTVRYAMVDAGDGNDSVSSTVGSWTVLGPGSDVYLGSAAIDSVNGGIVDGPDGERDVIDTGPAGTPNEDAVYSGQADLANPDEIRMGLGRLHWYGTATTGSVVDGGAGSQLLLGTAATEQITIDNVAGTVRQGSAPVLAIPGFTRFLFLQTEDLAGLAFRGSSQDEVFSTSYRGRQTGTQVHMGNGDDELSVFAWRENRASSYRGGGGQDLIRLHIGTDDLDLDLRRGLLHTGSGKNEIATAARAFEDAQVKARDIEVVGTNGPNDIEVHGCRVRVKTLGGEDDVSTFKQGPDQGPIRCARTMRVDGGAGNDVIEGDRGPDLLIGGPGRDQADGAGGRDTCDAEVRTSCEVRR